MNTKEAITWFKKTFGSRIADGLRGTPFNVDLVCGIAMQETGYIWSPLVEKGLSESDVLRLCVGDTLDADKGRNAFPRTKADLLAAPRGEEMFEIAREACLAMARVTPGYGFVVNKPNKFCHGFGIFQYDIQFFRTNPGFFLRKRWEDFSACLAQLLIELNEALGRQGWSNKTSLTDDEQVFVAIAYNKGTANPSLGFKQGHKADDGKFYGENINQYMAIARSITVDLDLGKGAQPVAAPKVVAFKTIGVAFEVRVPETALRLRSDPSIADDDESGNVIARLPNGLIVQRLSAKGVGQFMEIEAIMDGDYYHGWVAADRLVEVKRATLATETRTRGLPSRTRTRGVPAITVRAGATRPTKSGKRSVPPTKKRKRTTRPTRTRKPAKRPTKKRQRTPPPKKRRKVAAKKKRR